LKKRGFDVVWWGSAAVVACALALFAGLSGHGMWAAVGACIGLGGVGILIVRLDRARLAIERARHDTESVLQCLSSGLLSTDLEGRITRCNPAAERILGQQVESMRGHTLHEIFGTSAPLLSQKLLRSLREETPVQRFEMQLARPEGPPRPIGLSTSLLYGLRGDKTGLLATFQDLSDVRRMQERMRRADRLAAVGHLAASMAHEIRNPLAAIANSVDMMRDELVVHGEQRRLMDLVVKESERLNRILDDFLEYARARPLNAQVVPVRDALEEVVTLMRRHPDIDRKLQVDLNDTTAGSALASIDEEQLKQVYVNLALNACDAMGGTGVLQIHLERSFGADVGLAEAPYVRVRFRDSGSGLEPGQEASIFEPFYTTKSQGTGLGLSIAARIVESHGGRLEARNHSQGGAEFTIDLPEVTGSVQTSARQQQQQEDGKPSTHEEESVVDGEPVGDRDSVMEELNNGR
jgi:two-component system sensor histidine kinase PilS (NtrC family)